jgi:hypothetical protein
LPADQEQGISIAGWGQQMHRLAERVITTLTSTAYVNGVQEMNVPPGTYRTDCSGWVSWLVRSTAPAAYDFVPIEYQRPYPRAFMYWQMFNAIGNGASIPNWTAVRRLAEVAPGDIIAWTFEPESQGDSGHVLLVAAPPVINSNGTVAITVFDASSVPHNDDTRRYPPGGVGRGTILFQVDAQGAGTAFQFRTDFPFIAQPIRAGRLIGGNRVLGPTVPIP